MEAVKELVPVVGASRACAAIGMARSTFYRHQRPGEKREAGGKSRRSHRALGLEERARVLRELDSERYMDKSPRQVYASLLDEGVYLCAVRTMYRILAANAQVKERRDQLSHPEYVKPELLATGPNELWSWDITRLRGPEKWMWYYLYVILDVFSRYVVGWMVANRELAVLAERLIGEVCRRHGIEPGELTIHADRGGPMKSKPVALLLSDLGITKSHSRPHVCNDNPYSESHFKTLKYQPEFPNRFGSIQDARAFCRDFFPWYNTEHYHTGLGLMTPHDVHFGFAEEKRSRRAEVLGGAYARHPERFVRGLPRPAALPEEAWINKPVREAENGSTDMSRDIEIIDPGASMEVVSVAKEELRGCPIVSGELQAAPWIW
jgi:putative transposase